MTANNTLTEEQARQAWDYWYPLVYGYFYRRIDNRFDVEELACVTVTALLMKPNVENPKAFIWQTAKNQFYKFLTAKTKQPSITDLDKVENLFYEESRTQIQPEPKNEYSDRFVQKTQIIEQCIQKNLKDEEYKIVYSSLIEEKNSTQIGQELGLKPATVRQKLKRSVSKLKQKCVALWEANKSSFVILPIMAKTDIPNPLIPEIFEEETWQFVFERNFDYLVTKTEAFNAVLEKLDLSNSSSNSSSNQPPTQNIAQNLVKTIKGTTGAALNSVIILASITLVSFNTINATGFTNNLINKAAMVSGRFEIDHNQISPEDQNSQNFDSQENKSLTDNYEAKFPGIPYSNKSSYQPKIKPKPSQSATQNSSLFSDLNQLKKPSTQNKQPVRSESLPVSSTSSKNSTSSTNSDSSAVSNSSASSVSLTSSASNSSFSNPSQTSSTSSNLSSSSLSSIPTSNTSSSSYSSAISSSSSTPVVLATFSTSTPGDNLEACNFSRPQNGVNFAVTSQCKLLNPRTNQDILLRDCSKYPAFNDQKKEYLSNLGSNCMLAQHNSRLIIGEQIFSSNPSFPDLVYVIERSRAPFFHLNNNNPYNVSNPFGYQFLRIIRVNLLDGSVAYSKPISRFMPSSIAGGLCDVNQSANFTLDCLNQIPNLNMDYEKWRKDGSFFIKTINNYFVAEPDRNVASFDPNYDALIF